ncbi:MAG: glycerol-3-phosphate responsive antiterminator [Candidatus Limnocylindrales bacterium]
MRSRPLVPIFVSADGRAPVTLPPGLAAGILLRDLDLMTLVAASGNIREMLAVDLDSVDGLNPDLAAVRFAVEELGAELVVTRRPAVAAHVAALGRLALLHVLALDSTGLAKSLEGHPRTPGIGTIVSPGPVLAHFLPDDLARLPRPLVAYGFVETVGGARALLERADAVVVSPSCALGLAAGGGAAAGMEALDRELQAGYKAG